MSGGIGAQSRPGSGRVHPRNNHHFWGCWADGFARTLHPLSPRFIRSSGDLSMNAPVRVFLVDDVGAFRALMRFTLEEDPRIQVVGEAPDGFEAMPLILERSPDTTIVALSGFTAERMASLCKESGAYAYLEKGEDAAVIREAVLQ